MPPISTIDPNNPTTIKSNINGFDVIITSDSNLLNKNNSNNNNNNNGINSISNNVEPLTGIYIGCVLLTLLTILIAYLIYSYYKQSKTRKINYEKDTTSKKLLKNFNITNTSTNNNNDQEIFKDVEENGLLIADDINTANELNDATNNNNNYCNKQEIKWNIDNNDYDIESYIMRCSNSHYASQQGSLYSYYNSRQNSFKHSNSYANANINNKNCTSSSSNNNNNNNQNNKKSESKQLLNSKVSLILLSSLFSQDKDVGDSQQTLSNSTNYIKDKENLSFILNKLSSMNTLDKETANKLSDTINKYYEQKRKLLHQTSINQNMTRSKSLDNLKQTTTSSFDKCINNSNNTKNNLTVKSIFGNKHRRINSEKFTSKKQQQQQQSLYTTSLAYRTDRDVQKKRQWKSEKQRQGNTKASNNNNENLKRQNSTTNNYLNTFKWRNTYHHSLKQKSKDKQSSSSSSDKKINRKPTTIYELYKSNRLHVSSLFEPHNDN